MQMNSAEKKHFFSCRGSERQRREFFGLAGGDQQGSSIFLKLRYIDKQDALILNMASKIV